MLVLTVMLQLLETEIVSLFVWFCLCCCFVSVACVADCAAAGAVASSVVSLDADARVRPLLEITGSNYYLFNFDSKQSTVL